MKKNRIEKIKRKGGFTLSEMLMTVLVICLVITLLGGGVVVVKNAYDKVTAKAEAQTILSTAVTKVTDEFRYADVKDIIPTSGDSPCSFYSGISGCRIWFENDSEKGILKCRGTSEEDIIPLLTKETMAEGLIPEITYNYDKDTKLFEATILIKRANKENAFVKQHIQIKPVND